VILTYLSISEDDMNIYVFEKLQPKLVKTDDISMKNTYKDGIHIIYPFVCASTKVQLFFRDLVIWKASNDKLLDHLNLSNSIDDVFDRAIIDRNNWLLYGSCKDGILSSVYKLTSIYDQNLLLQDTSDIDLDNLPRSLSIRKFKLAGDHSEFIDDFDSDKIQTLHMDFLNKQRKSNTNPNAKIYVSNSDLVKAQTLVNMFGANRAKSYSSWIEVGFCLHNIDDSLLDTWIEFSKKSPDNFVEAECVKRWASFKHQGLGIGSLHRWAKEDNPTVYADYLIAELDQNLQKSLNLTSYAVAYVFYHFNKYQYVCTSIKNKKWYEYAQNRWVPMDEANGIIKKLNTELSNEYLRMAIAFNQKAMTIDDEHSKKEMIKKSKLASETAVKLQKMAFKKEVVSELLHLYYDNTFAEKLDENHYLIGFENGIYDLKNGYFRNGRPEDYISFSTRCNYIVYDPTNEKIKEVMHFLNQIQTDPQMLEYLLLKLSSFLEGVQRDQKFEIWTGSGANGKGRILKLLLDSFGDYGCTIPVTLVTKPRGDFNQATPGLAKTKAKRCCVFQEPENNDMIYVGNMKNMTGGDKIEARSLFSDPVEFYPQFKTILACNKKPEMPSTEDGTWRRVRVVPFDTKFVSNPTLPHERKKISDIDDLIPGWTSAFMAILIEKYKSYRANGIDEPPQVLIHTNEYQKTSDMYIEYITDNIFATETVGQLDYIAYEDLWIDFLKWFKDSNRPSKHKPIKSEFKSEMEMKLGKIRRKVFFGYRFKTNADFDNIDYASCTDKLNSSFNPSFNACCTPSDNMDIPKQTNTTKSNLLMEKGNTGLKSIRDLDIFDDDDELTDVFIKKSNISIYKNA
jgi:hypothetical protein